MNLKLKLPENLILKPVIVVFGVGGAGGNAVNNMISAKLQGVTFVVANTDAQALEHSLAENKIQLGATTTRGLGAGASPEIGAAAAEESKDEILSYLENCNMVFIAAGMGGGTGTGSAPVVARLAKELGILTVGVVTKPFHFEGVHRMNTADRGLLELQKHVDTLIVIPNQNLFRIANERTTFADAFKMADDVLHNGVRSVTDLMIMPGLINLDYADIKAVMSEMGKAMMGTGEASGDNRAVESAERAIANPLLEHHSMRGAKGVLINITGGPDMTLFEVDAAANRIREEVGDGEANIIFGSTFSPALEGTMRVSVVATGIDAEAVISIRLDAEKNIAAEAAKNPIEQITQTQEVITVIEETKLAQEVNEPYDLPPKFGEYNIPSATSTSASTSTSTATSTYTYTPPHQQQAAQNNDSGPLALLRKMWGMTSIKPVPDTTEERKNSRDEQPVLQEKEQVGEMYEIPAFLRRNK